MVLRTTEPAASSDSGKDGAWAAYVPSQPAGFRFRVASLSRRMPRWQEGLRLHSTNTVDFLQDALRDDLEVKGGVLAAECSHLFAKPTDLIPDELVRRASGHARSDQMHPIDN
jgi:hypothetical protein